MAEDYTIPVRALLFDNDQLDFHKLIGDLGQLLDKVVAMGTHVIGWQCDPLLDSPAAFHRSSQYLLTLHLVEQIDAISAMVRQGLSEPCKLVLRAMIESMLCIAYLHQDDVIRRGLAYHVGYIHEQIAWLRKLDPHTQEGKQYKASLDRNSFKIGTPLPIDAVRKELVKYEKVLCKNEFAPINVAWQEAKKKQHRRPAWYSLFGGPRNVGELAHRLNRTAWYETLYRIWSADVHASDCFNARVVGPNRQNGIRPIRYPEGIETITGHAISMALDAFIVIIESDFPDKHDEYIKWYVTHIQKHYKAVTGTKLVSVNFAQACE